MSANVNDIITDGSARFQVVRQATTKDVYDHESSDSAHSQGISGNAATATKLAAPVNIGNSSFDGSASIEVNLAKSAETLGVYTAQDLINMIQSSASDVSVKQITKASVTAPKNVSIDITPDRGFKKIPVEILKFTSGTQSTITEYTFSNGDADDFTFDDDYVEFDGTMHPKTDTQSVTMSAQTALGSGYISESTFIDQNAFKNVEFNFTSFNEATITGIALKQTGGSAAGTNWQNYEGGA